MRLETHTTLLNILEKCLLWNLWVTNCNNDRKEWALLHIHYLNYEDEFNLNMPKKHTLQVALINSILSCFNFCNYLLFISLVSISVCFVYILSCSYFCKYLACISVGLDLNSVCLAYIFVRILQDFIPKQREATELNSMITWPWMSTNIFTFITAFNIAQSYWNWIFLLICQYFFIM